MYVAKILEIYALRNRRHKCLLKDSDCKEISYLTLQIYLCPPPYQEGQPDRFTRSLMECAHVHYLFPRTAGQNLTEMLDTHGAVFLPQSVRQMLAAMAQPGYIADVEAELAARRKCR